MTLFHIYPAIDLRHGRVVRLQQGDPQQETRFSDDPVSVARRWLSAGAAWLHVVNLDGAFAEQGDENWQVVNQITSLGGKVQFGGGLRTMADIERAVNAGVMRVILGTAAVENPALVREAVQRFGAQTIIAGIDARDGEVRTHGWQSGSGQDGVAFGRQLATIGVRTVVHTDIARDGVLTGVNAAAAARLARETGLRVIASGGVATLDDIRRCLDVAAEGVVGVITGRALYDNKFRLEAALALTLGKNS